METALAQFSNYLPVIGTALVAFILIGFIIGIITNLINMEPKKRLTVIFNVALLILVLVIAGTGVLVMRDSMREATIIACQKQGMNYTPQQWDNGEVDYSKCNMTYVNGIMLNSL
jgi:apolipoprotein N-acyltransferase